MQHGAPEDAHVLGRAGFRVWGFRVLVLGGHSSRREVLAVQHGAPEDDEHEEGQAEGHEDGNMRIPELSTSGTCASVQQVSSPAG